MSLNYASFSGNLTRDPELKFIASGVAVTKFTVAVSKVRKKDGQKITETTYIDCEAWDSGAEAIAKYFSKGKPILVQGEFKTDKWTDKETNATRSKLVLRVNKFDFFSTRKDDEAVSEVEKEAEVTVPDDEPEGETPF